MDPLSKYIVVSYQPGFWEFYKTQHLDTIEKAREYVADWVRLEKELEDTPHEYKIFELKEVQC